jgi:hypothetical protein
MGQTSDKLLELGQGLSVERIIAPFALFPHLHQSAGAQHTHMVGQGRLTDGEVLQQFTGAHLPLREHFYDLKPVGVPQGLAQEGYVHGAHIRHLTLIIIYAIS